MRNPHLVSQNPALMGFNGDSMALNGIFYGIYDDIPGLVFTYKKQTGSHGPVEIVDLAIKKGGSFQFVMLNYQRVYWLIIGG